MTQTKVFFFLFELIFHKKIPLVRYIKKFRIWLPRLRLYDKLSKLLKQDLQLYPYENVFCAKVGTIATINNFFHVRVKKSP